MAILEAREASRGYREAYRNGVFSVVAARRAQADELRARYVTPEKMAADPEKYRSELIRLLGWPLAQARGDAPEVIIAAEKKFAPGVVMQRLIIETLPGLPYYGILFSPENGEKMPLVIAQHGGGGTPELISDMHGGNNYKHLVARLIDAGFAVFAPQTLMWRSETEDLPNRPGYGTPNDRGEAENALRHLGGSIASLELFSLFRALDALALVPQIDAARVGMIGLSYGGFYTHMAAALDARIGACVSNAFFNDRYAYCWHDVSWFGAALRMKDAEICGLIAPRALCVHVGRGDVVFDAKTALPEIERLKPFFKARGAEDKLKIIVSDVNHTLTDTGEEIEFLSSTLNPKPRGGKHDKP